ncbi:MAG: TlpA family protein disulfide reductase [Bacteroidetes bacterium]|nr:MAG: TlpA family protein disulfide reductase [Bacteroidota bacterium]
MTGIKKAILIGCIGAAVAGFSLVQSTANTSGVPSQSAAVKQGTKVTLPDFKVKDANGKIVNIKDFKGKMVFVNLWATWCGPCRREMPSIESLYKKLEGKNVSFVMLSLDDDFTKALNYNKSAKFTFPMYYPAANLPQLFNVDGIPATFIFNKKGELVKNIQGSINYDTEEFLNLLSGN